MDAMEYVTGCRFAGRWDYPEGGPSGVSIVKAWA